MTDFTEPTPAEPTPAEPTPAEPVAAEPVAAEPVAAEPVAAEPVAAEPVAAEPVVSPPPPGVAPPARTRAPRSKLPKPLVQATGRRKQAVARLRVRPGTGSITVNRHPIERYFPSETHRMIVTEPLRITTTAEIYDIDASIDGGGISGQAGALRLGIARALAELDGELRIPLKRAGLLSRDDREKESKKYGLKKARKAPQYSKR